MTGPPPATTTPGPLQRLHPLSPVLRGAKYFAAAVAAVSVRELPDLGLRRALIGLAIVTAAAFVAGFGFAWLSWRFTWYRIEGRELHLESGVLFRRSRRVPLERVQAIDIVRPLVGRALGLAELRLEVVGQGATEAPLAYLSEPDAQRLRARLLALAGGVDEIAAAPTPAETVLARVPTGDLLLSVVLLGEVVLGLPVLLVVALVVLVADVGVFLATLPVLGSVAYAVGRTSVRRLLVEYGFTVSDSPGGVLLRHGLLETRSQTIPPGRVQALRIVQPLLWRHRDWVRVEVDVAGYGGGEEEKLATQALLPVAPRLVGERLVHRLLADTDIEAVPRRAVPARAVWLDPVQWRQLTIGVTPRSLVVTSGRLRRVLDAMPLAKIQSLRLRQGPLQRRLGLASLHLDTAGRHLKTAAAHRDAVEALALVDEVSTLARAAREPTELSHGA